MNFDFWFCYISYWSNSFSKCPLELIWRIKKLKNFIFFSFPETSNKNASNEPCRVSVRQKLICITYFKIFDLKRPQKAQKALLKKKNSQLCLKKKWWKRHHVPKSKFFWAKFSYFGAFEYPGVPLFLFMFLFPKWERNQVFTIEKSLILNFLFFRILLYKTAYKKSEILLVQIQKSKFHESFDMRNFARSAVKKCSSGTESAATKSELPSQNLPLQNISSVTESAVTKSQQRYRICSFKIAAASQNMMLQNRSCVTESATKIAFNAVVWI